MNDMVKNINLFFFVAKMFFSEIIIIDFFIIDKIMTKL